MKNVKKKLVSVLGAALLLTSIASSYASADSVKNPGQFSDKEITISRVIEPKGNPNARVDFIDKSKVNTQKVSPMGTDRFVYKRSYYQVARNTITDYNVGPREKDIFLVSVPKGSTRTITGTKSVSATVSYQGSVSADIMKVINISLTNEISGSFSYTWSTSVYYSGPDGNYTTRDYYGAIQYDQYNSVVSRYDVYDVWQGTVYLGEQTVYAGDTNINGVKKPKNIEYFRDFNN